MIDKTNFRNVLKNLGFTEENNIFTKFFSNFTGDLQGTKLQVDFKSEKLIYPEDKKLIINDKTTSNFSSNENFVVFECVCRLLEKGYKPCHLELEPKWKIGHGTSGGKADILVKNNSEKALLIIECKTSGKEFTSAWSNMLQRPTQLFSYAQQAKTTEFLCLYTSDYSEEQVKPEYKLITIKDNEALLDEYKAKKLPTFQEAKEVEDLFKTWKESYEFDFTTHGIFEAAVPAYKIGRKNVTVGDLAEIGHKDIQGKYHEFATILRKHNVSGHENAFDKLVNLLLCKIVDETENPNKLKFYWQGIAYDNHFDLQDRLQQLYKSGMKEFLGEDVTYVDNNQIEEAFRFVKNDPDATRNTIKKFFRELKFFTNNDFAFIDVHNENLFYKNAAVLLEIVRIFQDIRLKTDEQNQFLGDMFEGFLDQGVKQSEGQFFTPMPIVKFILSSLPLENIIKEAEQIPKIIDYACGAGHFLNEYAVQIAPFVEKNKKISIEEYYPEITGIEKEYRLSKVAKVSAFMYGQDDINIIYDDALAENNKVKDGSYSLLVANPPYSVKGFLETLRESDRAKFELFETVNEKSYANNNSIETFFIERAKQLLKPGGIAGIIVPSSILSKGSQKTGSKTKNTYVTTREIILKYFDIIAIAEFGSGTFGKTGTNTVTLFMRRKKENPSHAEHYKNRVDCWFKNDYSKDSVFEDERFIRKYCNHVEVEFDDYKTLLTGVPNTALLDCDIFKEYKKDFDKLSDVKNKKKQLSFKNLSKEEQRKVIDKMFLNYLTEIEKDKLYYFILASLNPQDVVIVKTPSDNSSKKKFLGYEWSSAKGSEGIKYIGGKTVSGKELETNSDENVELEQDDTRVLSNMLNLSNIYTPLYDPKNLENSEKINSVIRNNFSSGKAEVPEDLKDFVTTAKLTDMLDFSRIEFKKDISLTPKKSISIETKWPLVKLGDVAEIKKGTSITQKDTKKGNIPVIAGGKNIAYWHNKSNRDANIITVSASGANAGFVNFWKHPIFASDCTTVKLKNAMSSFYLYNVLINIQESIYSLARGAAQPHVYPDDIKLIKIPLPPKKVQEQIVNECEAIDSEYDKATKTIEATKKEIEEIILNISSGNYTNKRLADIAVINPSKTEIKDVDLNIQVSFIEMASVSEKGYIETKEDRLLKDLKKGSYTYFKEDDLIFAKITPCMENGKCAIAMGLTNQIGMGSSEFHVFRINSNIAINKFVFLFLNRSVIRNEAAKNMTGSSGHRRVPISFYESLQIPVSPLDIQRQFVSEIEKLEEKINKAEKVIAGIPERKKEVLNKYL